MSDLLQALRDRPWVTAIFVMLIVIGAVSGFAFDAPGWPLWRRVIAGIFVGAGSALILTASRLLGATEL